MTYNSYILIGGRSSRMGTDKALLTIDGETFAERAVNTVTKAFSGSSVTLIARDENQFKPDQLPHAKLIFDIHPDRGPYSGLHAALTNADTEWIFVLACDCPFVTAGLLTTLAQRIDDQYQAIVPIQSDGRAQPLCAFYRTETFLPLIEAAIASNNLPPLRNIFNETRAELVPFAKLKHLSNAEFLFTNINYPEDLTAHGGANGSAFKL